MNARPLATGPIDLLTTTGDALAEVAWEQSETAGTAPTTATRFFAAFPWEASEPAPAPEGRWPSTATPVTPPRR